MYFKPKTLMNIVECIARKEMTDKNGTKIFARKDEDGLIRYTCTEDDPAYQAWLNPKDEGGTL